MIPRNLAVGVLVLAGLASGLGVRSRSADEDLFLDQSEVREQSDAQVPSGKIVKVIEMLENLIKEMDAEQVSDDAAFKEFGEWCTTQQAATQASIDSLTQTIEELTAALAELYAQKEQLEATIKQLKEEIKLTRTQIKQAKEKRAEEKASFEKEQQDFDSSIAACNKAIEILKKHYGDGEEQKAEKPAWMSLLQVTHMIRQATQHRRMELQPEMEEFLQTDQPTEFNRYESKSGEAGSIVDQMKLLADTFAEDKQSAIDEENRLAKLFANLMKEKTELLNSLIAERDAQQAILDQVNQDIGEKETAKANAEAELEDEQKYLAQTKLTCEHTAKLYEMRKKDRAEEKTAVGEAVKVLSGGAGEFVQSPLSFLQQKAASRAHLRAKGGCPRCRKAAALLQDAAKSLRSGVLATAAAATMGSEAVQDVINALQELIVKLDEDQKMEKAHKDWCETELSETNDKKSTHESNIEDLKQKIADETETIAEKKRNIEETNEAIATADKNFDEATEIRAKEKEAFEKEQQDYVEALAALNQAIDILAKFYASKKKGAAALIQEAEAAAHMVAPRAMAPGVFDDVYESKGGKGVVEMISVVRTEFELGKKHLEEAEAQAIADYQKVKEDYKAARDGLVQTLNRFTVELEQAENNLDQFEEDKAENERELAAAIAYLEQLGASCNTLLEKYDDRKKLRKEEKESIKKAMKVLEEEA